MTRFARTYVTLHLDDRTITGWRDTSDANAAIRSLYARRISRKCTMLTDTPHDDVVTEHVFGYYDDTECHVCHRVTAMVYTDHKER